MIRRRHTPGQIIRALREAEVGLANGKTVGMVSRDPAAYRASSNRLLGSGSAAYRGRGAEQQGVFASGAVGLFLFTNPPRRPPAWGLLRPTKSRF